MSHLGGRVSFKLAESPIQRFKLSSLKCDTGLPETGSVISANTQTGRPTSLAVSLDPGLRLPLPVFYHEDDLKRSPWARMRVIHKLGIPSVVEK